MGVAPLLSGGEIAYSLGGRKIGPKGKWLSPIWLKAKEPFTVNGRRYLVPAQYRGFPILVLPLAHGIVWAAQDPKPLGQPILTGTGSPPSAPPLEGYTPVFYTRYGKGGSLAIGAKTIARVPWSWPGLGGPVAASAWASWLPKGSVVSPSSATVHAHLLTYSQSMPQKITSNVIEKVPWYPTILLRRVGLDHSGKRPCVAYVSQLDRTEGGFVLEVRLIDPNYGMASGMVEAAYYWSEARGTWTPLTQLYAAQDLMSFVDVGRDAVYWQQPLPQPTTGQDVFGLVQARFDPATLAISPVFAGDYIYGSSFVDGETWVHEAPSGRNSVTWTAYTPPAP
jgi:hypothetical protein